MAEKDLKTKVNQVLKKVKPMIRSHGGDVKLVSVKNGLVKIKVSGACVGCPLAQATFDHGLREMIKEKIPQVKKVEFVS